MNNVSLEDVCRALRGKSDGIFPIGTEIEDTWTDVESGKSYLNPLIIAQYDSYIARSSGEEFQVAVLLRRYVLPKSRMFDKGGMVKYEQSDIAKYLGTTYAEGCSKELLAVAQWTMISTGYGGMRARFFIPSISELMDEWEYSSNNLDDESRFPFSGFMDDGDQKRHVWLRPDYFLLDGVRVVSPYGAIDDADPSDSNGVLPACIVS